MPDMATVQAYAASLIRHGLVVAGGILVKDGYLDQGKLDGFVGGGMIYVGLTWSYIQKVGIPKAQAEIAKLRAASQAKDPTPTVAPTPVLGGPHA